MEKAGQRVLKRIRLRVVSHSLSVERIRVDWKQEAYVSKSGSPTQSD